MFWEPSISKKTRLFLLSMVVLLGTGCVMNPGVNMAPPLTSSVSLAGEQGGVVVHVVNASNLPLPFNYLTIAPKDLNASDEVKATRLEAMKTVGAKSSIFASVVSPGEYSISSLRVYHSNGNLWFDRWARGSIELGTFQVKPGQTTDLGTLIYYPKIQGDSYVDTLLRSPLSSAVDDAAALLPFFGDLATADTHGWDEDDYEADRRALYTSAVQNPVVYNRRYMGPDGSLFFIGKLGTLLIRDTQQEWHLDAVDTDADLIAVAKNEDGDVAVGGEFGALFVKDASGEWRDLSLDGRFIVEELLWSGPGQLDVIARSHKQLSVMRRTVLQGESSWKTLATFWPNTGWQDAEGQTQNARVPRSTSTSPRIITGVSIAEHKGQHHLFLGLQRGTTYSVFSQVNVEQFTYDPQTWRFTDSKGFEKGIDAIIDAGAIDIGVKRAGFWSWDGRDSYLRYDADADDWIKMMARIDRCPEVRAGTTRCINGTTSVRRRQSFNFLSAPVFSNDNEGLAFVSFVTSGANQEPVRKILSTEDGGKNWQETELEFPSKYCVNTVPEAKGVLLVSCFGVSSDFYESYDNGRTWEHVREHESI